MFDQATIEMLLEGVVDTLYMTLVSTFFSYVFGMMMGTVLVICRQDGITPRPMIYAVLDVVVNLTRSFPFLILMIAVIPLTRLLVGTTIGNNATVVPLVIAAAPFVARQRNPPCSKWTAASLRRRSPMGASTIPIILKVLLPEALPSLINGSAIAAIRSRLLRHVRRRRQQGPRQTGDHVRVQPLPDRHHISSSSCSSSSCRYSRLRQLGPKRAQAHS
ncbi:MAG: methionine ABC transporter permease [Bilophila wadsworthia]